METRFCAKNFNLNIHKNISIKSIISYFKVNDAFKMYNLNEMKEKNTNL